MKKVRHASRFIGDIFVLLHPNIAKHFLTDEYILQMAA